jgi:hypothetical protein
LKKATKTGKELNMTEALLFVLGYSVVLSTYEIAKTTKRTKSKNPLTEYQKMKKTLPKE